ncbi:MAG TPA: hypothetical protein VG797_07240, partial [Phycisphaerales bacterium]|nr:hypothetical protein [Phycisphaerales bacterium]
PLRGATIANISDSGIGLVLDGRAPNMGEAVRIVSGSREGVRRARVVRVGLAPSGAPFIGCQWISSRERFASKANQLQLTPGRHRSQSPRRTR